MEVVKAEAAGRLGLRIYPRAQGRALRVKAGDNLARIDPATSSVYAHRFRQLFSLECKTLFK